MEMGKPAPKVLGKVELENYRMEGSLDLCYQVRNRRIFPMKLIQECLTY